MIKRIVRKARTLIASNSPVSTLSDPHVEYGSHFIPLAFGYSQSSGAILEMGSGHYSTPLLHALNLKDKRKILTTDTSKEWLSNFKELENDWHQFQYIPVYEDDWEVNPKPEKWEDLAIPTKEFGLIFVDHRPGERRKVDIARFAETKALVIVHDSQEMSYGYEEAFSKYKYRLDYKRFPVHTTILSNELNVEKFVF